MECTLTEYLDRELEGLLGHQDTLNYKFMVDIFYEKAMNDVNENGERLNEYVFKIMMMFYTVTMLKIVVLKSASLGTKTSSKTSKVRTFLKLKPRKSMRHRKSTRSSKNWSNQTGGFGAKTTMGLFAMAIWTLWCGFCFYDSVRDFKHITKNPPPMVLREFPGVKKDMKELKSQIRTVRKGTLYTGRKYNPMDWVRHIGKVAKVIMELIHNFVQYQLENTFKKSLGVMLFSVTNDVGTACIDNFELIHTMENLETMVNVLPELGKSQEALFIAYLEKDPMKGLEKGTLGKGKELKRIAAQEKFDTIRLALPAPNKSGDRTPEPEASWSFSGILGGIKDVATGAAASAQTIALAAYAAPSTMKDWYEKIKYVQEIFRNNPGLCMYRTAVSGVSLATQKMNSDKAIVVELLVGWGGSILRAGERVGSNYTHFFWSATTFFLALAAAIRDHDSDRSYKRLQASKNAEIARFMSEQQERLEQQQRQIKGLKKAIGAQALGRQEVMELPMQLQLAPMNAQPAIPINARLAPNQLMNQPMAQLMNQPLAQSMNQSMNQPALPPQGPIVFEQANRPVRRRLPPGEIRVVDIVRRKVDAPFLRFERLDEYNPDRVIYSHTTDQANYRRAFEYSLSLEGTIKRTPTGNVIYKEGDGVYKLDAGRMIP